MDCREVCDKIYDYIEHQLTEQELLAFEEHMKNCKHCQEEYYRLEKLMIKLKNIKDLDPPPELKVKILDKIKENTNKKTSKILYFKKYSYVAAALILFIGGFYIVKAIDNSTIKNGVGISAYTTTEQQTDSTENQENQVAIARRSVDIPQEADNNTEQITQDASSEEYSIYGEDVFGNSRSIDINEGETYIFEKEILTQDEVKTFKHDIALYKNQTCSISFENLSSNEVTLYVTNIDNHKVSEKINIPENSIGELEYYITDDNVEQDVFTVVVDGAEENIQGYLKVEIVPVS